MSGEELAVPAVSLAEAQAFARVETGEEEALLAGMVRAATALCESFIGQVLVERRFEEVLPQAGQWQRLATTPLRSIGPVEMLASDGGATSIPASAFEMDIDSRGDGWLRFREAGSGRIRVGGTAGLATEPNGIPEPLRHGILRLAAHLFQARDGDAGEPPAAVTALWRPYRRMRLA